MAVYRDEEAGFTLTHPDSWLPLVPADESQRLILNTRGESSFSVRYNFNAKPVDTEADLQEFLPATDMIAQGKGVEVLKRQTFNLNNGIIGVFYLSRFSNRETGRSLVNAQYFLFKGRKMFVVLYQAAPDPWIDPADEFERALPEIEAVLATFTIDGTGQAPTQSRAR